MAELRKLAGGVYAYLQPPLVWYSSAGVIVGDRDVIVVDSLTNAAAAQDLRTEIRRVTDKPIRFLINTHWHPDHVFTNHLFPEATVIGSHRTRELTLAGQEVQGKHTALFARLFPDVDFSGGRYTPQDMSFSGTLSLYQGQREVRVIELGQGHSESDVVVYLPAEQIVFCGDVFVNGMAPLPGEGHVTQAIANYEAIEALEADLYVAGHGDPGTLADVRAQGPNLKGCFSMLGAVSSRA
jgi:cyclase